ncbi:sensor histidine kinase [Tistrella mobilis]
MVIILIGLAVVDTFGPVLERQIKSLSTLPDLKQVARQVGVVADLVEDSPPADRDAVLAAARRSGWVLFLAAPETADRLVTGRPEEGLFDRLTSWSFMPEDIEPPVGGWRTFLGETRVMVLKIDQGQTLLVATLTAGDGVFVIEVADNGPGIPQDQRPRVLDPFFKLDTARRDGGTGFSLGLAIVAEIVQAHRGSLDLADNTPQGLRVRVTMPTG